MKQLTIICTFMALAFMCEGQVPKDSLPWATPAEKEMFRSAIKKGRSQKALGSLAIVGGAALTTVGVGVAFAGIKEAFEYDDDYYDQYDDTPGLLLKGGGLLFAIGLGTIVTGADMIKDGTQNVRKGKVCLKINSTSVGLVINF
jgi:hypothetical protein